MKTLHNREGDDGEVIELYPAKIPQMEQIVQEKIDMLEEANKDDAFFIVDLGEIYRKLEQWWRLLPRVQPCYALKCNPDPEATRFLADAGVGFDCASKREMEQILELGVHPSRIVYANPCKPVNQIKYAAQKDVQLMTFDGIHELVKTKKYFPSAKLLLRIQSSREHKAKHNFNKKFGCNPSHAHGLLSQAKEMGLNIVGVSFHVGSLPEEVACFASTIAEAHDVFTIGEKLGFQMEMLDIGGGFPGVDEAGMTFEKVADVVNKALDRYFPPSRGVRVIAEPGRYLVSSAFTLAVNIIAKRVVAKEDETATALNTSADSDDSAVESLSNDVDTESDDAEEDDSSLYMYYVNDGIYGAFNNVFTDHAVIWPKLLPRDLTKQSNTIAAPRDHLSLVWGPTCDSLDCVLHECRLPELEVGQWLFFYNMGAYTISLSCDFNGISRPLRYFVCADVYWDKVYPVVSRPSSIPKQTHSIDLFKECDTPPNTAKIPPSVCPSVESANLLKPDVTPGFRKQRKDSHRLALFKGE